MSKKKQLKPSNSSKKRKKKPAGQGDRHFCWVCGQHKAHEKFSGRGHATHMCKQCHALPVAMRNEMVATRRAENMAFRYLNDQEIKWLRKRMNDPRPEVRDAAREAHRIKFPRYERNTIKKGLTARSLELYINGEVLDEYRDEIRVHMQFIIPNNSGVIRRIDYNAPEGEQETEVNIGHSAALKFLKAVIHQLDALFWSEDLSDANPDNFDPYLNVYPEHRFDYDTPTDYDDEEIFDWALYVDDADDNESEGNNSDDNQQDIFVDDREPIWSLRLLLTKGIGEKIQTFYNQMHDEPQELFWLLMEWFELDNEDECDIED